MVSFCVFYSIQFLKNLFEAFFEACLVAMTLWMIRVHFSFSLLITAPFTKISSMCVHFCICACIYIASELLEKNILILS